MNVSVHVAFILDPTALLCLVSVVFMRPKPRRLRGLTVSLGWLGSRPADTRPVHSAQPGDAAKSGFGGRVIPRGGQRGRYVYWENCGS